MIQKLRLKRIKINIRNLMLRKTKYLTFFKKVQITFTSHLKTTVVQPDILYLLLY